jgi:hypothetical protein
VRLNEVGDLLLSPLRRLLSYRADSSYLVKQGAGYERSMSSLRRDYVLTAAVCALAALLYVSLQRLPGPLYVMSNTVETAFSIIPLVLAAFSLRMYRRDKWFGRADSFLFVGFLLWFLGEFAWSFYSLFLGVRIPYPSLADVFWLAAYPFVVAGMLVFIYPFRAAISIRNIVAAHVVSLLAIILVLAGLIIPVLSFSSDISTNVVGFAYPMLDIALLSVAIMGIALFWGGKIVRSWYWLIAGAVLMSVGDILFSYLTARRIYYSGHPLELFFEFSYACFGLAMYERIRIFSG